MKILKKEMKFCTSCMEEHEVYWIEVEEKNIFKNEEVTYNAVYEYCERAEEYHETENEMAVNDIAMKNAYRKQMGLLTSGDISFIRQKFGISQSDLAEVLGWGSKTITRYERHQVQDLAHDTILRKINDDPAWYIELLNASKHKFSTATFQKYYATALELYETKQDEYLKKSILASYAKYEGLDECNGGRKLAINKVIDIIRYFANSHNVQNLFKVKLMKMLWYADALSYKNTGISMTGLVYKALPMGAVPIAHERIVDLKGINYEEVDFEDWTGYHFISDNNNEYLSLSKEDIVILDKIISCFGSANKKTIVSKMHEEQAYIETAPQDIIQYKYTKNLSIDL